MAKQADKLKDIRETKPADLEKRLVELKQKLQDLSFQTKSDEVRDVREYSKVRKDIARILTVMKEKSNLSKR